MGTLTLLEAAREHGIKVFVMASSSSVYGQTKQIPFHEDAPADRVLAAYPASKRSAEILAHTYHNLWDWTFANSDDFRRKSKLAMG